MTVKTIGKRVHGLWEGVSKRNKDKRVSVAKRYWSSVKTVPTNDGGFNIYVWGKRKKK